MTKLFLAAGVAALAIAAPAAGQQGGKGRDKAQAERSEGKGRTARVERRGSGEVRAQRSASREMRSGRLTPQRIAQRQEMREGSQRVERVERRAERQDVRANRIERQEVRTDRRANRVERQESRTERRANRVDRQEVRAQQQANRIERQDLRQQRIADRLDRRELREQRIANRLVAADAIRVRDWNDDDRPWIRARGLIEGCPPGLDMKNNGCLPPGQAKKLVGTVIPAAYSNSLLPLALQDVYADDDDYYYRYGNGYIYRVDRDTNLIASLLPLFTGGYMPGQLFPSAYMNSYVPNYYQPFYMDTDDSYYRYANGYIYEIDPYTGLIEDIDPAYGYGFGVGQLMPASYSYYNVPYQYRSYYYDTDDYYYRYAPGAIYQVDRGSSLITAVAALLSPTSFGIGQQLPVGYNVYNVPYAYRSTYYDTPDAWYRYNNGYIYQVDPTTQLITAIVRAIV